MAKKKPAPTREDLIARASKLRNPIRSAVAHWLQIAEYKADRAFSCLHPPESRTMAAQYDRGKWLPLHPKTPRWAVDLVRAERLRAETRAQVVWPNFADPDPLPPVSEGRRVAWSVRGMRTGDHMPYRTLQTPTHYGELFRGGEGPMTLGTVPQYETETQALRAAHYRLCREVAEAMMRSLTLAHGTETG